MIFPERHLEGIVKLTSAAALCERARMEKRAKAYGDMESYVCDLARAGTLAMTMHDREDLFLFVVDQFDNMAQRFRQLYYAVEFPPE
jgi:hypothetical protein